MEQDLNKMSQCELIIIINALSGAFSDVSVQRNELEEHVSTLAGRVIARDDKYRQLEVQHNCIRQMIVELQRHLDLETTQDSEDALTQIRDETVRRYNETSTFVDRLDAKTQECYQHELWIKHLDAQLDVVLLANGVLRDQNSAHIKTNRAINNKLYTPSGGLHVQA